MIVSSGMLTPGGCKCVARRSISGAWQNLGLFFVLMVSLPIYVFSVAFFFALIVFFFVATWGENAVAQGANIDAVVGRGLPQSLSP